MPFTKTGPNSYTSPSGRHFNEAQVRLYYANGGHFPGEQSHSEGGIVSNKGYMGKTESFAAGGQVLGRTKDFMKQPDRFRDQGPDGKFQRRSPAPSDMKTSDDWGKDSKEPAGAICAPPARDDKCLPTVKPHK